MRILPPLSPGDTVLTKLDGQRQWAMPAVVHSTCSAPRSYVVETGQGDRYRRNRRHLMATPNTHTPVSEGQGRVCPEEDMNTELTHVTETPAAPTQGTETVTRSGRVSKPVHRLDL